MDAQLTLQSKGPMQTEAWGFALGQLLQIGDVVCLDGELGAGKSCMARAMGRGLGVPDDDPIHSPSFTLIAEHQGRVPFVHADLYRITEERDLDALGLDEYFEQSVTAVEWFDRFDARRPKERIDIRITMSDDDPEWRTIGLRAFGASAVTRLNQLGAETRA